MKISELLEKRGLTKEEVRSLQTGKRTFTGDFISKPLEAEKRSVDGEVDAPDPSTDLILYGYSAVFDSDSELLYGFIRERIQRGAFKECLRNNPDVRLLENHDGRPHARTTNGTLILEEKPRGLYRTATLNASRQDSRDLYEAVKRGDYSQSSFAFICGDDEWITCPCVEDPEYCGCDCEWQRTIIRVAELIDDSIVTYPAYPATTASVVTNSEPISDDVAMGDDSSERSTTATPEERVEPAQEILPESPECDIAESIRIWASI